MGPQGFREIGELIVQQRALCGARRWPRSHGVRIVFPDGFFKEFVVHFDGTGQDRARRQRGAARARDFRRPGPVGRLPGARPERALLRHRDPQPADIDRLAAALAEVLAPMTEHNQVAPLSRGRLGRAGRHGDGPARAGAASCSPRPSTTSPMRWAAAERWSRPPCAARRRRPCRKCRSPTCSATTCICRRRRWA